MVTTFASCGYYGFSRRHAWTARNGEPGFTHTIYLSFAVETKGTLPKTRMIVNVFSATFGKL
jgi:hypothetical protein